MEKITCDLADCPTKDRCYCGGVEAEQCKVIIQTGPIIQVASEKNNSCPAKIYFGFSRYCRCPKRMKQAR
jgi:hypothetical protein